MSYDKKFRKRAIKYLEEVHSYKETAKTFGISPNTLNAWIKKYRNTGSLDRKYRQYSSKISAERLEEYITAVPDAYQYER